MKDTQRILRALAVYQQTGKPLSYYQNLPLKGGVNEPFLKVSLQPEKQWLNARIEKRYLVMEENGVEAEMKALFDAGYSLDHHGIQTLGAREFFQMFEGERGREEVSEKIILQTKQYAKRQLTWARTQFSSDVVLAEPCDDVHLIFTKFTAKK